VINANEDVSTGTTRGFISNQQINCDDCECKATSTNDMENLVSLEHKVKELFSCKLCDFDPERGTELKTHNDKIFMT
jgi:hypothetical protein